LYSPEIESLLKSKKIKPGDRVGVSTKAAVYEGLLMPRIEFGDPSSLVLKLDSGYNIGIKFGKDVRIKKFPEKKKLERFPALKLRAVANLPKISLLATGGTIASRVDYVTGGVKMASTPQEILFAVPELNEIASLKKVKLLFNFASEDLWYNHWQEMAEEAAKEINSGARGVIITHGTDTMHFSSAALSFMLRDLSKPVVFTGSQRSSDRGSSDAKMNLVCSARVAGYSGIAEVGVCMHASENDDFCNFIRGTKVRKMHSTARNAFKPINESPLAKIYPEGRIEITNSNYQKVSDRKVKPDTKFEPNVALVKVYPGSKPNIINFLINEGIKGIVLEGTGMGHVPTQTAEPSMSWIPAIQKAINSAVPIVVTTQTIYGRTNQLVYKNLRILAKTGAIFAEDMLPETAYVKLGWVLGHENKMDKIREIMLTNIAGEISERTAVEENE